MIFALEDDGAAIAAALLTPGLQSLGRLRHGFRGPQGQSANGETYQSGARLPPRPTDVAALPDPAVIQALVAQFAG